jgi:uncharacterized protein (TIGR02466 family)
MIDLLFPRSVYRKENLFTEEERLTLESHIKENLKNSGVSRDCGNNVDSSFYTANQLDKDKNFKQFSDIILDESKIFLQNLSYDEFVIKKCKIHKMWANISYENDFIFPHTHGDCLVAGVFYVKSPPEAKIYFFDNFEKTKIKRSVYNNLSYEEYSYDCLPGRLLIFENNMIHGNKKQPPGEKIAISFNIGL